MRAIHTSSGFRLNRVFAMLSSLAVYFCMMSEASDAEEEEVVSSMSSYKATFMRTWCGGHRSNNDKAHRSKTKNLTMHAAPDDAILHTHMAL